MCAAVCVCEQIIFACLAAVNSSKKRKAGDDGDDKDKSKKAKTGSLGDVIHSF